MSTSQSTLDYILDQTRESKVSALKMFGEYTLYANEKVIGVIADDTLYIKITPQGKEYVGEHYQEAPAYEGAKPAMLIDGDLIEDVDWLNGLIAITEKNLPVPKPKKKPARKTKKT